MAGSTVRIVVAVTLMVGFSVTVNAKADDPPEKCTFALEPFLGLIFCCGRGCDRYHTGGQQIWFKRSSLQRCSRVLSLLEPLRRPSQTHPTRTAPRPVRTVTPTSRRAATSTNRSSTATVTASAVSRRSSSSRELTENDADAFHRDVREEGIGMHWMKRCLGTAAMSSFHRSCLDAGGLRADSR